MSERVGLVDYGAGNVGSVRNALAYLEAAPVMIRAASDLENVDRIILPGVGAFPSAMARLRAQGLVEGLADHVLGRGKPFLGICVGMQILATVGEEFEKCAGLGWIPGRVRALRAAEFGLPVPHMGWNDVTSTGVSSLVPHDRSSCFYFVHSFQLDAENMEDVSGWADYGEPITAMVERDNILGVQFHPEKSQHDGLNLLRRFLRWNPVVATRPVLASAVCGA